MSHDFDKDYWEQHWQQRRTGDTESMVTAPPNPYLVRETDGLAPGTALDAGCGAGAEAIWLATRGWQVTAVDISREALSHASERAAASDGAGRIQWVEADLSQWVPDRDFDLVMTHYAHPAMPQLAFYDRITAWVKPGGTLLLVGHLHAAHAGDHGHHHPPAEATVTAVAITERLDPATWRIETADERERMVTGPGGREITLHDVIVRAVRLA